MGILFEDRGDGQGAAALRRKVPGQAHFTTEEFSVYRCCWGETWGGRGESELPLAVAIEPGLRRGRALLYVLLAACSVAALRALPRGDLSRHHRQRRRVP